MLCGGQINTLIFARLAGVRKPGWTLAVEWLFIKGPLASAVAGALAAPGRNLRSESGQASDSKTRQIVAPLPESAADTAGQAIRVAPGSGAAHGTLGVARLEAADAELEGRIIENPYIA